MRDKFLVGLIGSGIQRSLTPAMHEEEARAQGLRLHYQLIDLDFAPRGADALPLLMDAARAMRFAGLNITYPCKQAVIPLLDAMSERAEAMGAVNTVVARAGQLIGHNTDGDGWAWGFKRALPQARLGRVALIGAGGAGSAIAHALVKMGTQQLVIVDPELQRAQDLASRLGSLYGHAHATATVDAKEALDGADGLVHATPTGMDKLPGMPVPASALHEGLWVSEIVYFPLETELLRTARERGCAVSDGGGMAVGQAVRAFELFTGRSADEARMDAHFRQLVAKRAGDSS